MPVYLDVGAVRIQHYLARWPSLASRRGASAMLNDAMSGEALAPHLKGRAEVNRAAGSVDGVINLVVADRESPDALARDLLSWLRSRCPGAEFEASWGRGESYVDAYASELGPRKAAGEILLALPTIAEFPLARTCGLCSVDPAVDRVARPDAKSVWACEDCRARAEAAGRRRARPVGPDESPSVGLETERWLLEHFPGVDAVGDFEQLAALSAGRKRNHLATVFIDGNAVGQFFEQRLRPVAPGLKDAVSREIVAACRKALVVATTSVYDGGQYLVVVPHVRGGDDVLVSVPAPLAWRFTCSYLRAFGDHVRSEVEKIAPGLTKFAPTASAGIVFANASHPFTTCVDVADRLLKLAKSAFVGGRSAVLWVDITQEGEEPPEGRRPWALDDLEAKAAALTDLAELPRSRRSSLGVAAAHPVPSVAAAAVARLAERLDVSQVLPFLEDGDVGVVRDALALSRWWQ